MKKIIAICLSLILVASFATPVFAYSGSGEVEVTAHVYSSYDIFIPATIDAYAETAQVKIVAQLEDNYKVDVYVLNANNSGDIPLTHTNGVDEILCRFKNIERGENVCSTVPLVTFYATELVDTYELTKSFGMEVHSVGKPGNYTGTMVYSFDCTPCE